MTLNRSWQSPRSPSICLVTGDFAGIVRNSGIGTYFFLLSRLLAARGWNVHVLYVGGVDDPDAIRAVPVALSGDGIAFHWLDGESTVPTPTCPVYGVENDGVRLSQDILALLEEMQAEHHFDVIEFPDWRALGFRAAQAKRANVSLGDARLAVNLHGMTRWQRDWNFAVRQSIYELQIEWCERYAFEHADFQLSPSQYMIDYSRSIDWPVRDDVRIGYPFPDPEPWRIADAAGINELVFFGRLERRKGLDIFLDALDGVDADIPVLFLGKDTDLDGRPASEHITTRLGERPHRIDTQLERRDALATFASGDRLAVLPSSSESFGFAVAECIVNEIPFLAAGAGAIPEVVLHPEARRRWLFAPSTPALADRLAQRLRTSEHEERRLRADAAQAHPPEEWNDRVEHGYRQLLARRAPTPRRREAAEPPTVTIGVTHYNKAPFLPSALRSLAEQSRPADQVIIVDDGSTDEAARSVLAEQERLYPDWTFLRQANAGPGAARNTCLAHATSTYFQAFDADNIATRQLVQTMLDALRDDTEVAAVTCHTLAFVSDEDIAARRFAFRFSPVGGPLLLNIAQDVYGDAGALFRTDALRAVGGFETEEWSPNEDWETFVKLALHGHRIEVVPRTLYYYRTDVGGRLQTLNDAQTTFRQGARMMDAFLADAPLTHRERLDLWECLRAYAQRPAHGYDEAIRSLRSEVESVLAWREADLKDLRAWHEDQMEALRASLTRPTANPPSLRKGIRATIPTLPNHARRRASKRSSLSLDDAIQEVLKPVKRPVVLDVGANVGQSAMRFKRLLPRCEIHCFEPSPHVFLQLKEVTAPFADIWTSNVGLGSTPGEQMLFENEFSDMSSFLRLGETGWGSIVRESEVGIDTADAYCARNDIRHVDLLEVDTQGFELEVLRGASSLLAQGAIATILIEINTTEMYTGLPAADAVLDVLKESGFTTRARDDHALGEAAWYDVFLEHTPRSGDKPRWSGRIRSARWRR